jgi:hypothetical protein
MTKLLLALVATATLALAADPFLGSWKPNLENWKLSPDGPERRKLEIITVESAGRDSDHYIVSRPDLKAADTQPRIWIVDGKEHEDQRLGVAGTNKMERISERHLRTTIKSAERAAVYDWVVTADGKTLTVTRKGTGIGTGRKLDEFLVYNKQ